MNLRIVTNGHCLLNCKYCHREGAPQNLQCDLTMKDFIKSYECLNEHLPLNGITITGYEPLHYPGFPSLVNTLCSISSIRVLTSGAVKTAIPRSCLKSIHTLAVSLPSFSKPYYKMITRQKNFTPKDIEAFIEKVENIPSRIEINAPIVKGLSDDSDSLHGTIESCQRLRIDALRFISLDGNIDSNVIRNLYHILGIDGFKWLNHRVAYLGTYGDLEVFLVRCTIPPPCFSCEFPSDIYIYVDGQVGFCLQSPVRFTIRSLICSQIYDLYKKWRLLCYDGCFARSLFQGCTSKYRGM